MDDNDDVAIFAKPNLRGHGKKKGVTSKNPVRVAVYSDMHQKRPKNVIFLREKQVDGQRPQGSVPDAAARLNLEPGVKYSLDKAKRWEIVKNMDGLDMLSDEEDGFLFSDEEDLDTSRRLRVGVAAGITTNRRVTLATRAERALQRGLVNEAPEQEVEHVVRRSRKGHGDIVTKTKATQKPNSHTKDVYDLAGVDKLYVVQAGFDYKTWCNHRQQHHRHCNQCNPVQKGGNKHKNIAMLAEL